jgi:TonB family protein
MPELARDPRGMLAAALPLYDFDGATMKPWHIKGTYQLFDESGNPSQVGSYEYWWKAPRVYRSSWERTDATRTEWHAVDGKTVYRATGDRLFYFEHDLESLLFSPLPDPASLDPTGVEFGEDQLELGKIKQPCAKIIARTRPNGTIGTTPILPGVPAGNYCFDPSMPVLRVEHLYNAVYVEFDKLTKIQNRVLAREITITDGRHKLLAFNVGMTDALSTEDEALSPPVDAIPVVAEDRPPGQSVLAKKVPPVYPYAAKASRVSGVVILDTVIGKDGHVRDIRVLVSPSPLLTSASKDAVSQWQYAPFIVDGKPQEVNMIIDVFFSLGY